MQQTHKEKVDSPPQPKAKPKPKLGQLVLSVLAAAVGVQSNRNREQDFQQSSILPYIVAGIVFTILFLTSLIFIVSLIVD